MDFKHILTTTNNIHVYLAVAGATWCLTMVACGGETTSNGFTAGQHAQCGSLVARDPNSICEMACMNVITYILLTF